MKQLLPDLKGDTDANTVRVGNLKPHEYQQDRLMRQKSGKKATNLTRTTAQMDLTELYRTFHPTNTEYTFFFQHYIKPYPGPTLLL